MGRIETCSGKRKVLLVVRWPVGGIRTFLRYVYRHFAPERWEFTILAPDLPEMQVLMDDLAGLDFSFVSTKSKPNATSFARAVFREICIGKYDLVHSHGFTSAICASGPAFLWCTPHLITSHDVINTEQFNGWRGLLKKKTLGLVLRLAAMVHSVSHDAEANLRSFFSGLSKEKSIVIPNGIEVERFLNAVPVDVRRQCGEENAFLIGFFGRFMNQKGFRYLVDAIEVISRDSDLEKHPVVLAYGVGGFIEREKRDIERRGLEPFFRFMPFEPNIAGVLKSVDAVVMPSLWEACPLQPMEALVCGTPLIASDCIGLREVTSGTPTIRAPMRNALAIAEAVKSLIRKPCRKLFADFVDEAARRYDVKAQSRRIQELYDLLCP